MSSGKKVDVRIDEIVSVPSFGDSFFIYKNIHIMYADLGGVSVPSFGDSFFIES